jgi:hypothetical protein
MTLLNLDHFAPPMLFSLCRTLTVIEGGTRQDLLDWLEPSSYGLAENRSSGRHLTDLLRAAQILGLIEKRDESFENVANVESLSAFKLNVLRNALAPERNTPLLAQSDGAQELIWALTWMMSVECTRGPFVFDRHVERLFQGIEPKPFQNSTRWPEFIGWALFLGFGWNLPEGFIPDPTDAILWLLDAVLPAGQRVRATDFAASLAEAAPVLDGGAYRSQLDELIGGTRDQDRREELSEPLSLALLRLERKGVLTLEKMADGEALVAKVGDRSQLFHFVARRPEKTRGADAKANATRKKKTVATDVKTKKTARNK